jgi:chemotaxis protein CheD
VTARREAYLLPGQLLVSREPCRVTTILGSCVAACVWDTRLGIGGLTHHLLPFGVGPGVSSARFGNLAVPLLIDELLGNACRLADLRAKVFGGACVLEVLRNRSDNLGTKNLETALAHLAARNVPVLAQDAGGWKGRKLIFHTDNGESWVRRL